MLHIRAMRHTNITSSPFFPPPHHPAQLPSRDTTSTSSNAGATVPSSTIADSVLDISPPFSENPLPCFVVAFASPLPLLRPRLCFALAFAPPSPLLRRCPCFAVALAVALASPLPLLRRCLCFAVAFASALPLLRRCLCFAVALASRYSKASALDLSGRTTKRALAPGVCSTPTEPSTNLSPPHPALHSKTAPTPEPHTAAPPPGSH